MCFLPLQQDFYSKSRHASPPELQATCPPPTTAEESSVTVHGRSTHSEYYAVTASTPPVSRRLPICSRVEATLYASTTWSGFTSAADRQRVDAFLRRSKRRGFCPPDLMTFKQLVQKADQQLFNQLYDSDHCLHSLLSTASQHYHLRQRAHDRYILYIKELGTSQTLLFVHASYIKSY